MEKRLQDEKLLARHTDDASHSCLVSKANRKIHYLPPLHLALFAKAVLMFT